MNNKTEKIINVSNLKKKTKKIEKYESINFRSEDEDENEKYSFNFDIPKILIKYKELKIPKKLKNYNIQQNSLKEKYRLITQKNLNKRESSSLLIKKFNSKKKKIEISDDTEFILLYNFILDGHDINISKSYDSSHLGRVIFDGYYRFLNKKNFITFTLKDFINNLQEEKNKWFKYNNLEICLNNCDGQYLLNHDDRYIYYCCLCLKGKEHFRIPIYQDRNKDLVIPSINIIQNKKFFSMINISNDESFLDYNILEDKLYIIIYSDFNMLKYNTSKDGICIYSEFTDYNNKEYLKNIRELENNNLKK